jgi:hypothetical protein
MTIDQGVGEVLDQTIQALTVLDLNKLQALERRISAMAESDVEWNRDSFPSLVAKKRLLELVLQNCKSNLDTLNRLYGRNMRDQWAH